MSRAGKASWLRPLFVALVAALPLAIVVYPALVTLGASLFPDGAFDFRLYSGFVPFADSPDLEALEKSVLLSVASALLAAAIGVPLGILLEWFDFPGKGLVGALLTLPVALPPLIGTLAFYFLYGESGIVPRGLQALFGLDSVPFRLTGVPAVLLVHAYTLYVFFYLFTRAACRRLDRSSIEAARSLGASGPSALVRVVLPQLLPAIGGAGLLVFMTSMASFSAPFIFATSERLLSLEIFHSRERGEVAKSLAETSVLTAASLAALFLFRGASGGRAALEGHGLAPRRLARRSPLVTAGAGVAAFLLALVLLLPHATIVLLAFAQNGTWTSEVLPPRYTLDNFAAFFGAIASFFRTGAAPALLEPLFHSVWMTAVATAVNVAFGILAAILLVRVKPRAGRAIEAAILLAWALPGTAVAVNLLTAFPGLVGTVVILPIAYVVRNLPVLVRSSSASLAQVPVSLEEAARGLGAGRAGVFRRVLLPLVLPGVVAGALLVFVTTLGEFVATILLYTPRNVPISIQIAADFREYNFGSAAAYGVVLLVLIGAALAASRRFFGGGAEGLQ